MRKIVLEEKDIKELEQKINNLPTFAKNVGESFAVAGAVQDFMTWIGGKVLQEENPKEDNSKK